MYYLICRTKDATKKISLGDNKQEAEEKYHFAIKLLTTLGEGWSVELEQPEDECATTSFSRR